jgi:hypothetical protein
MKPMTDDELKEKVLSVLGEARGPMTQDAIMAVIMLREEAAHNEALAKLVLDGKLSVTRSPDAGAPLDSDSFVFAMA